MTLEEVKKFQGKTIILRKKNFIGKNLNHDIEYSVMKIFEKSVMCENKYNKAFIPTVFFLERSTLITPEGNHIVSLPHWFYY